MGIFARFAQHWLLRLCIYFWGSLKVFQAQGRPKTPTTQNLAGQLKLPTVQRHPGNDEDCSLCWERDPVPESAFGRVCLASCQINIYSQIYLFAFVIENSCGFFFVCVCALFCSPCVFLAVQCWREGLPQPFLAPLLPAASPNPKELWSLFCKVGPAWQLSCAWAQRPPHSPLCPWAGGVRDRKGLSSVNTSSDFPFLCCGSQWSRGVG